LFEYEKFDKYDFKDIPLNEDVYIIDEIYLKEYETQLLKFFDDGADFDPVGYCVSASVHTVSDTSADIIINIDIWKRFHNVNITLPKDQFVACVGSWQIDEKPHLFVKSEWFKTLYLRNYSIFAFIDVADFAKKYNKGEIQRDQLLSIRDQIDDLAKEHKNTITFITFADTLILKSNWTTANLEYTYSPNVFIDLSVKINKIYSDTIGLSTYTIITQGSNEYYGDVLLHIAGNHICLNSLGVPFEQLKQIEIAAKQAISDETHKKEDIYMDSQYFYSLNFTLSFDKSLVPSNKYQSKLTTSPLKYYYSSYKRIVENLKK
jgi:hypothetical protein